MTMGTLPSMLLCSATQQQHQLNRTDLLSFKFCNRQARSGQNGMDWSPQYMISSLYAKHSP